MNKPSATSGAAHLDHLDSIRGLAALTVMCEHYVISFELPTHDATWRNAWDYSPLHIFWDGGAAVSLFFVLSGLVLSVKYFRAQARPDLSGFSLTLYFASRCFRLFPPYWCALALSAIGYGLTTGVQPMLPVERHSLWLDELWGHSLDMWHIVSEANLLAMPKEIVIVPQAWTLSIELLMSLLVPIGVLLAGHNGVWLLTFTVLAIKLLGAPAVLFHFVLGVLLAKYYQEVAAWLNRRPMARRGLLVVGILFYTASDSLAGHITGDWGSILSALGAGSLLLYSFASTRAQALLNLPALRYLGRVSFSFYLLHMLVLLCAMPFVWAALQTSPLQSQLVWWFGLGVSLGLSLAIAGLSYRYVEVPSICAGKALAQGVQQLMGGMDAMAAGRLFVRK